MSTAVEMLPFVMESESSSITLPEFLEYLEENNAAIKRQLLESGAILFRNFPVNSLADFDAVIAACKTGPCVDYIGGDSPRIKVHNQIYTSTEAPPNIRIPLHNELSFVKNYPTHIYFYCDVEPVEGGATPVGDARAIYNAVDPEVRQRFEAKGLKYISRYWHRDKLIEMIPIVKKNHKPWRVVFETESKEEVERLCRENDFGCKWNKNDWVEITQTRPGVMKHPVTGENTWFNQAHLFDFNPRFIGRANSIGMKMFYFRRHTRYHEVYYGDGSKISRDEMYHIWDVLDAHTLPFHWKKGDVLLCDNVLTMHAREPFKGPRRILTAMTREVRS